MSHHRRRRRIVAARSRTRRPAQPGRAPATPAAEHRCPNASDQHEHQLRSAVEATAESPTPFAVLDAGGGRGARQRLARRCRCGRSSGGSGRTRGPTAAGSALSLLLIALVPADRHGDDLDVQGRRRRGARPAGLRALRLDRGRVRRPDAARRRRSASSTTTSRTGSASGSCSTSAPASSPTCRASRSTSSIAGGSAT